MCPEPSGSEQAGGARHVPGLALVGVSPDTPGLKTLPYGVYRAIHPHFHETHCVSRESEISYIFIVFRIFEAAMTVHRVELDNIELDDQNDRTIPFTRAQLRATMRETDFQGAQIKLGGNGEDSMLDFLTEELKQRFAHNDADAATIEHICHLAEAIGAPEGLVQPIIAKRTPTGRWQIVAGNCRLLAHEILEAQAIKLIEFDAQDSVSPDVRKAQENLTRHDLNPLEEIRAIRRLIAHSGEHIDNLSINKLVRLLKLPRARAQRISGILKCEGDAFKQLLESGTFKSIQEAYDAAQLDEARLARKYKDTLPDPARTPSDVAPSVDSDPAPKVKELVQLKGANKDQPINRTWIRWLVEGMKASGDLSDNQALQIKASLHKANREQLQLVLDNALNKAREKNSV